MLYLFRTWRNRTMLEKRIEDTGYINCFTFKCFEKRWLFSTEFTRLVEGVGMSSHYVDRVAFRWDSCAQLIHISHRLLVACSSYWTTIYARDVIGFTLFVAWHSCENTGLTWTCLYCSHLRSMRKCAHNLCRCCQHKSHEIMHILNCHHLVFLSESLIFTG